MAREEELSVRLEVRLFGGLSCKNEELTCFGQSEFFVQAPEGITAQQFHEFLKLGAIPVVTAVNGVIEKKNHILADNDRVGIFPPVAGG